MGSGDFIPFDDFNSDDIFPNLTDVNNSSDMNFDDHNNLPNDTILSFNLTSLETNLINLKDFFNNSMVSYNPVHIYNS